MRSADIRTSFVLTVIGDDRPGIVETLSDRVLAAGANWEESRMAHLAGKFAGLLRVSVDADRATALADALQSLEAEGLTVVAKRTAHEAVDTLRTVRLELVGNDRPGIVRDISRVLARHRVNIEEIETGIVSAPMSGDMLFQARAVLGVPAGVTIGELRATLEALAGELMVDLTLAEEERRRD